MTTAKSIAPTQRLVLASAAERPSRSVLPLPSEVPARGIIRQRLLSALLRAGLAEEVPTADRASAWRADEAGGNVALRITDAGFAAIGLVPPVAPRRTRARAAMRTAVSEMRTELGSPPVAEPVVLEAPSGPDRAARTGITTASRPRGKLGEVWTALSAESGATLLELVALTGWLPHTTRAALTRLRQRGYPLDRVSQNGRTAYRLGAVG